MVATYTAAPGDNLIPGASGVTEWQTTVGGVVAACGEAALTELLALTKGTPATPAEVTSLTQQAVNNRWTVGTYAYAGQSSPQTLSNLASAQGVTLQNLPYQTALSKYAGVRPITIGVSNARAFGGDDSNVQGHYVTVVGVTGAGNPAGAGNYIVSDPNQKQSTDSQLVVYSPAEIAAAAPFSAQVPTTGPTNNGSNTTPAASSTSFSWNNPTTWLPSLDAGLLAGLGISNLQDLLWRAGFILMGSILIIIGFLVMFQRQAEEAIGTTVGAAAKAG